MNESEGEEWKEPNIEPEKDEGDSMDWTPGQCLRETAVEADQRDVDACIVLMLDKGPEGKSYWTNFRNAGMTISEAVALMEYVKHDLLNHMLNGS